MRDMAGRPLPSVESLRCFVAAAEQSSFRRAAERVGLTPAAVSQRIKQLEEMLECRLFERSSRRVELTPDGQALLARALVALQELAACADVGGASPRTVRMSLGTRFELGMSWLIPALVHLRAAEPRWHLDVVFGSGTEILRQLDSGGVDAIITSAPTASAAWTAHALHPEGYSFVAAPSLVQRVALSEPADSANHTLIDISAELPLARYLLAVCPELSFADVWQAGTGAAVRALVLAELGVAVLPTYMVQGDLDGGRMERLLPEYVPLTDSFRLLYRTSSPLRDSLRAVAEALRAWPLR